MLTIRKRSSTGNPLSELLGWRPQPKQAEFLRACGLSDKRIAPPMADVIGYGGAAGGGKSDALLALACAVAVLVPGVRVGIFRRRLSDMAGAGGLIQRSHEMLAGLGRSAQWNSQRFEWKVGRSRLHFCYCENENDVYRYQGWQFDVLLFDEATHFSERQVAYLTSRARLNVSALTKPVVAMASNPGNVGHAWFERIFQPMLPSAVRMARWQGATQEFSTYFIPARLSDNAVLCQRDPTYQARLESLDEVLRLQLLEGRWDVYEGVAFPHQPVVVSETPEGISWARWAIGIDWGYSKPFAAVLVAKLPDERFFVASERYEAGLTPAEQAERVLAMRAGVERLHSIAADASTFAKYDGVASIADQWRDAGLIVSPATRDRLGSLSLLRSLFREGRVLVHRSCENLLRELRTAQMDTRTKQGEDIAGEDHAIDALRYALAELVPVEVSVPPPTWSVAWIKEQARLAKRTRADWE
jgi:hypothetical protein